MLINCITTYSSGNLFSYMSHILLVFKMLILIFEQQCDIIFTVFIIHSCILLPDKMKICWMAVSLILLCKILCGCPSVTINFYHHMVLLRFLFFPSEFILKLYSLAWSKEWKTTFIEWVWLSKHHSWVLRRNLNIHRGLNLKPAFTLPERTTLGNVAYHSVYFLIQKAGSCQYILCVMCSVVLACGHLLQTPLLLKLFIL